MNLPPLLPRKAGPGFGWMPPEGYPPPAVPRVEDASGANDCNGGRVSPWGERTAGPSAVSGDCCSGGEGATGLALLAGGAASISAELGPGDAGSSWEIDAGLGCPRGGSTGLRALTSWGDG